MLIPAAPTIRNRPFSVPAVRLRTVLRPRPLIGPEAPVRTHAASAPGALWSTRSVGILVRAPGACLSWRMRKMPAASVAVWRLPPSPIRRPSTVDGHREAALARVDDRARRQRGDALQRHEAGDRRGLGEPARDGRGGGQLDEHVAAEDLDHHALTRHGRKVPRARPSRRRRRRRPHRRQAGRDSPPPGSCRARRRRRRRRRRRSGGGGTSGQRAS